VSYPQEPLENYDISKNTAGISTNTKKELTLSSIKESTASDTSHLAPFTFATFFGNPRPRYPSAVLPNTIVGSDTAPVHRILHELSLNQHTK
jgi:hypothetical protein